MLFALKFVFLLLGNASEAMLFEQDVEDKNITGSIFVTSPEKIFITLADSIDICLSYLEKKKKKLYKDENGERN